MNIKFSGNCFISDAMTEDEYKMKDEYIKSNGHPVPEGAWRYPMPWIMAEKDFFERPYDVNVLPHGRYTPSFIHEHEFIELIFLFSGQCTNKVTGQHIPLESGDVCLISPGTKHALEVFNDDTFILNFLIRSSTFEKAFFNILSGTSILADFFRHIFFGREGNACVIFPTKNDSELQYYLGRIYEESRGDCNDKNEMMDTMLTMFFLLLIRRYGSDMRMPSVEGIDEGKENHPVLILKYMQENYRTATLKEMAQHFHYSERHMKRMIVKCTGKSFSENILSIRMNEAANLLKKTKLPVSEIALKVGYRDVSGFRLAFRKYFHEPPGQYRSESL